MGGVKVFPESLFLAYKVSGNKVYKQIAENLGAKLPPTVKSSSRGVDNPSGIHFYRVPAGWKWKGKFGADVHVTRTDESTETHPTKNLYHDAAGAMRAARAIKDKLLKE